MITKIKENGITRPCNFPYATEYNAVLNYWKNFYSFKQRNN